MHLRSMRKNRGITQYRLAGLADVPVSDVYRIERRGMRPTAVQARRIAEVLQVDPGELREAIEYE